MNSKTIMNHCLSIGVTLLACGGKLTAQPASMLTGELRAAIKLHKNELLELLAPTPKRAIIRFKLLNGQGGVVIGSDTDTPESLIDTLRCKFGNRLDSFTPN